MPWWVLTLLHNSRAWTSLYTYAWTHRDAHLFMAWAIWKPSRKHIYRTVRGTRVFCGYQYVWDTPHLVEQDEAGDTYTHTFRALPLRPTDHVWYYLFSFPGPYGLQCQGPLIHIEPPEAPMPSARISNTLDQPIATGVPTAISYDSTLWDDGPFYDPALPTRLTAPMDGLYAIGCCQHLSFPHDPGHRISITLNGANPILMHGHRSLWPDPPGSTSSLHTIQRLLLDDFLQVIVYHWAAGARNVAALPDYSPHFWIAYLGPYPA